MNMVVDVQVDDRETQSGVVEELKSMENVHVTIRRLPVGDYQVDNLLLFERKTLPDLINSIIDGRLFRQGCRLAESPLKAVLILEGVAADIAGRKIRREAVQGAVISLTVLLGIPVLRSLSPAETVRLMLYASRQLWRLNHGALPRRGKRPRSKRKRQLHILQGLPGIGPGRASRLLDEFGTIEAVISATFHDLLAVPGIGRHTAKAVRWAVSESPAVYEWDEESVFQDF